MASEELKIVLGIEGDQSLKSATAEANKLDASFTETMSDGQKMAAVLNAVADELEVQLKQARVATDALSNALGTEGVAQLEKMGMSVSSLVAQLHDAGLAYTAIEADAGALAASSTRLESLRASLTNNVIDPTTEVTHRFGKADGAVRAFSSQAVQELGALRGQLGPMSSAVGQLAGWVTTGGIGFGDMVKLAAPMVGISAAIEYSMSKVAEDAKRVAEARAFDAAEVKAYVSALQSIPDEVDAIRKKLEDAGSAKLNLAFFGSRDVTESVVQLGLTAGDAAKLISEGRDRILEWGQAQVKAGADTQKTGEVVFYLTEQAKLFDDAGKAAAVSANFLGNNIHMMGEAARIGKLQIEDLTTKGLSHSLSTSYLGEAARAGLADNKWQKYVAGLSTGHAAAATAAKQSAQDQIKAMFDVIDAQAELGEISQQEYRARLEAELGYFEKYSADYMAVVRKIQAIDKATADQKQAEADAAAKAAKDAADAAKQAEKDALEMAAHRAIVAADIGGATYATINTAADPRAVVNAIREFVQYNGPIRGITP